MTVKQRYWAMAALLVAAMCGCRPAARTPVNPTGRPTEAAGSAEGEDGSLASRDATSYRAISDRNLFRPLVAAPKSGEGGAGEVAGGAGAVGTKAGGSGPGGPRPSMPMGPPDPTADLALTGIIETTDGLRVLVEQISTRKGEFVGVGEFAFGFTVKAIGPDEVTLAQGPKTYELKLGAKDMPTTGPAVPATTPTLGGPPPSASSSSSPPSGMPNFGGMSSDQRRQAFQNWWNGMPEEQRQQFRERRGGSGGGFGGRGGGGGDRGDRGR